jgi:hypothetical protein
MSSSMATTSPASNKLSPGEPSLDRAGVRQHIGLFVQRDPDFGPVGFGDSPIRGGDARVGDLGAGAHVRQRMAQ